MKSKTVDELFTILNVVRGEWVSNINLPTLSEFINQSIILIRKKDNECIVWHPNEYSDYEIKEIKIHFRVPNVYEITESIKFDFWEKQYEFQMWGLQTIKDTNKLNKGTITLDEFHKRHPEIKS